MNLKKKTGHGAREDPSGLKLSEVLLHVGSMGEHAVPTPAISKINGEIPPSSRPLLDLSLSPRPLDPPVIDNVAPDLVEQLVGPPHFVVEHHLIPLRPQGPQHHSPNSRPRPADAVEFPRDPL
jgi:hypothetical protein